ncbi:MAG TPA: LLM class flavin-dependent oxidoreductase [Mycobacteriales bacterium]
MRLGVNLVYQGAGELARAAEQRGYALALAPEGYRSDAASVLGLVAGQTSRIGLVSGVMQIPARSPGLAALTAATVDALSGGRFRLGLGVSNPDVSEGWYGVPFGRPLGRTREYVEIVRLAGEIADGWIGVFTSPDAVAKAVAQIRLGRARVDRSLAGFEILPGLPTAIHDDPEQAADVLRGQYVYLLGMGTPDRNFYCSLATQMGFGREVAEIHERLAAGDRAGAARAVPFRFIDETSLIGPVGRVAERMHAYAAAGVTTLGIMVSAAAATLTERVSILDLAARALDRAGLAD